MNEDSLDMFPRRESRVLCGVFWQTAVCAGRQRRAEESAGYDFRVFVHVAEAKSTVVECSQGLVRWARIHVDVWV